MRSNAGSTALARIVWAAGSLLAVALVAAGCHGFTDHRHAISMHNSLDYEDYCWNTSRSSVIDSAEAEYMLAGTLFPGQEHEAEAWPGLTSSAGLNALLFVPMGACPEHDDSSAAFIEYAFVNAASLPAYCGGSNCVGHYNPVCSSEDCSPGCGVSTSHCHYRHQHVNLKDGTMSGTTAVVLHTINHETGHVLGLLDPVDNSVTLGWNHCRAELVPGSGIVGWVDSIMHAPLSYCADYAPAGVYSWPRPLDREAVKLIMSDAYIHTSFLQ